MHARRLPLPVERDMRTADQRRPDVVGLGGLDLRDRRLEVGHVQREELDVQDLAAVVGGELAHPVRGDLAIVVICRNDVDLLAEGVGRVLHQLLDGLARCHARGEHVAVADAALVLVRVEIRGVELAHDRSQHLARGGGDAAEHHGGLVGQNGLTAELRIHLHVRLRIEHLQLDLATKQAPIAVLLGHGELERVDDRRAIDIQPAGQVIERRNGDGGVLRGEDARAGKGGGRAKQAQRLTTVDFHFLTSLMELAGLPSGRSANKPPGHKTHASRGPARAAGEQTCNEMGDGPALSLVKRRRDAVGTPKFQAGSARSGLAVAGARSCVKRK